MAPFGQWLIGVGLSLGLLACQQEPHTPQDDLLPPLPAQPPTTVLDTAAQKVFEEFRLFLGSLPCDRPEQMTIVVQEYQTVVADLPVMFRDAAFVDIWYFYFDVLEQINLQRANDPATESNYTLLERFEKERVLLDDSLQRHGFRLLLVEGLWVVGEDPDFLPQHFYARLSRPFQFFLDQHQREVREGFIADATLLISPKQLGEWAVFWEVFTGQYEQFPLQSDIAARMRRYRFVLLEGTDNSPAFDYESGQLTLEFEQAYRYLVGKYPQTRLGRLLNRYQEELRRNDWRKTPEIEQFIESQRHTSSELPHT
ncbi:MAG: hypothetical protein ACFCUI_00740 [Bernardetiaceae bacterium]